MASTAKTRRAWAVFAFCSAARLSTVIGAGMLADLAVVGAVSAPARSRRDFAVIGPGKGLVPASAARPAKIDSQPLRSLIFSHSVQYRFGNRSPVRTK